MAHYLVTATPREDRLDELRERLDNDEFSDMQPFGQALTRSLGQAKLDPGTGQAIWEEEDYCTPPLRQERQRVLDTYFTDIQVEQVQKGEGWDRIADLPSLWDQGR